MVLSPDKRLLAFAWDHGRIENDEHRANYEIHIWDVAAGKPVRTIDLTDAEQRIYRINPLAISPDGRFVAFYPDGLSYEFRPGTQVWEIASGSFRGLVDGHRAEVTYLAFAPDGRTLATGSADSTVLIWDLERPLGAKATRKASLTDKELSADWQALIQHERAQADTALWRLVDAPTDSVPFFKQHLPPAPVANPKLVRQWIIDLGSAKFGVRQKATHELEKCLDSALPALLEAANKPPSVEVHLRLQKLIDQAHSPVLLPEQLRQVRAVEVLEHIGSKEARDLLQTLAQGAAGARLTQEAQAALGRLKQVER